MFIMNPILHLIFVI